MHATIGNHVVEGFGAIIKTEQLEHDPPPTMPYNQHYTTPQNASVYGAQLYVIATTLCNCR
jgi:hypothetical protein